MAGAAKLAIVVVLEDQRVRGARPLERTEPAVLYRAGQSFHEAPDAIHQVSANASTARPVRFLGYFVCDRQGPLSVPAERP
jgi:hypothetical protein